MLVVGALIVFRRLRDTIDLWNLPDHWARKRSKR
jgi:hypothetical protein